MPSKSPAQARLMRAVAHGWKKPGGGGPSQEVAREFVNADRRGKVEGYQFGGPANYRGVPRQVMNRAQMGPLSQTTGGPGSPWRGAPPPRAEMGPRRGGFMGGRGGPGGRMDPRLQRMRQQQGGMRGQLPGAQGRPQGGPQGGALRQLMQQMQQQQGRIQKRPPGGRMAPPPGKYPGGGNPMMGGRNPMMRQRGRYMGASPTRMMR